MHMGKGSNIQILYQDNIDRQTQNTHINEVGCVSLCSSCRLLENGRLIYQKLLLRQFRVSQKAILIKLYGASKNLLIVDCCY